MSVARAWFLPPAPAGTSPAPWRIRDRPRALLFWALQSELWLFSLGFDGGLELCTAAGRAQLDQHTHFWVINEQTLGAQSLPPLLSNQLLQGQVEMCRNHLLASLFKARVTSSASPFELHSSFITRIRGIHPPSASPAFSAGLGPARGNHPLHSAPLPALHGPQLAQRRLFAPFTLKESSLEASLGKTPCVKHKPTMCVVKPRWCLHPLVPLSIPKGCRRTTTTCPSPAAVGTLTARSMFSLPGPKLLLYQLFLNILSPWCLYSNTAGWCWVVVGEGEVCIQVWSVPCLAMARHWCGWEQRNQRPSACPVETVPVFYFNLWITAEIHSSTAFGVCVGGKMMKGKEKPTSCFHAGKGIWSFKKITFYKLFVWLWCWTRVTFFSLTAHHELSAELRST